MDRRPAILKTVSGLVLILVVTLVGVSAIGRFEDAAEVRPQVRGLSVEPTPAPTSTTVPPSSTSTSAPTTTTSVPPPLRTATLLFTGDTLGHSGVVRQAAAYGAETGREYDFSPMFELVEPYIAAADLAICHLETPLSPDNRGLSGYPTFNVPGELAAALAGAGYDGCSVASNHSLDRRKKGVIDTLDILEAAGLGFAGTARSEQERASTRIYDAAGIAVAHLSYTYGLNGFTIPRDSPWLVNEIDLAVIRADAARARDAGAEYVVVSLHWGDEYRTNPSADQARISEALLADDNIDLLVGHHAHVVQPIDQIDGKFVIYGLGNFLSNQSANCCEVGAQDGVMMQVNIQEIAGTEDFRTWLTYIPTRVDRNDFRILPLVDVLDDDDDDLDAELRAVLERSRERTTERLSALDGLDPALFEAPGRGLVNSAR